jgi:ubiquinone/menaquinone biosynthesis C-methylase UbiE
MGRLARRNLKHAVSLASGARSNAAPTTHPLDPFAYAQINLTRGGAQHLPFPNAMFDTVVATFPAEYIFEAETLAETQRVLAPGGRFIILPGAIIIGRGALDRLLAWVFRITGEAPRDLPEILRERPKEPFAKAGFQLEVHEVAVRSSVVFIMAATKTEVMENLHYAAKTTGTRQ